MRIAGQQLRDRPGLLAGPERYRAGYRDRLPQLFTATVYRKKASQRKYREQGAAGQGVCASDLSLLFFGKPQGTAATRPKGR